MKSIKIIIEQTHFAGQDRYQIISLTNAAVVTASTGRKLFPAVSCGSSLSIDQVIAFCKLPEYETTINYTPNK